VAVGGLNGDGHLDLAMKAAVSPPVFHVGEALLNECRIPTHKRGANLALAALPTWHDEG